jgi:myosin heavy subunit
MGEDHDPDREVGHADMISLPDLTADTMRGNLLLRFESQLIYTYTGSILVSVNPYKDLPIYDMGSVRRYMGQRLGALPPHVFAIADVAFSNTLEFESDQSVVISGESGAGKTEATKLIVQYLSARTEKRSVVETKMLQTSPIMEAFGNAKTVRNNNSSRFGKFMEIHFSEERNICGARIVQYLLEKSRISFQAPGERNYHVFYELLAGCTDQEKQGMNLDTPDKFHYLNQSGTVDLNTPDGESVDEGEELERVREAFSTLGVEELEQRAIFCTVAAVLHIGNITFSAKGPEGSQVAGKQSVQIAARLLGIPPAPLDAGLVTRLNFIRGQKFVVPLTVEQGTLLMVSFPSIDSLTLFPFPVPPSRGQP